VFVFERSVSGVVISGEPPTPRSDGVLFGSGSPPLAITTIKTRNTTAPTTAAISRRRL
jgi:hypothetical protein